MRWMGGGDGDGDGTPTSGYEGIEVVGSVH